jgi:hypothetical protein
LKWIAEDGYKIFSEPAAIQNEMLFQFLFDSSGLTPEGWGKEQREMNGSIGDLLEKTHSSFYADDGTEKLISLDQFVTRQRQVYKLYADLNQRTLNLILKNISSYLSEDYVEAYTTLPTVPIFFECPSGLPVNYVDMERNWWVKTLGLSEPGADGTGGSLIYSMSWKPGLDKESEEAWYNYYDDMELMRLCIDGIGTAPSRATSTRLSLLAALGTDVYAAHGVVSVKRSPDSVMEYYMPGSAGAAREIRNRKRAGRDRR